MRYLFTLFFVFLFTSFSYGDFAESRGLVKSAKKVSISTDLVASVSSAPFHSGMEFNSGDTLLSFDCRRYDAELRSSEALADGARIEYRNKDELYRHGAAGKSELEIAKASLNRAEADVELRRAMMVDCTITAPFAGRVVDLSVGEHEMPRVGEPIITILDASRLELELVVPSHWLLWLGIGEEFMFHVDETGLSYSAFIDRLGAEVDPVSQTIKAFGKLREQHEEVLAGMSGAATFNNSYNEESEEQY